jgi:hypothetical protein
VLSADDMLVEIADAMAPDKPVLGQRLAVLAVSAWRSASSEAALVAWLDRLGVPDLGVVRRLHRVFGDVAMERIAANPYVMVPLLPWKRTDAIGKRLILEDGGDPAGDRRRIVGAADEAVKQMLRRGDTASSARDFGMETANLLALPLVADAAVTIAAETGAVLPAGDVLRAPGAAALEDDLAFRLRSVIAGADASRPAPRPASEWAEMLADLAGPGRALEDEQNAAVVRIMSLPLACLVGGAGVGKTFTCKMVCDCGSGSAGTCCCVRWPARQRSGCRARPAVWLRPSPGAEGYDVERVHQTEARRSVRHLREAFDRYGRKGPDDRRGGEASSGPQRTDAAERRAEGQPLPARIPSLGTRGKRPRRGGASLVPLRRQDPDRR